jgi:hypothetical protein
MLILKVLWFVIFFLRFVLSLNTMQATDFQMHPDGDCELLSRPRPAGAAIPLGPPFMPVSVEDLKVGKDGEIENGGHRPRVAPCAHRGEVAGHD